MSSNMFRVKKAFASYRQGDMVQFNDIHAKQFAEFLEPVGGVDMAEGGEKNARAEANKKLESRGKK